MSFTIFFMLYYNDSLLFMYDMIGQTTLNHHICVLIILLTLKLTITQKYFVGLPLSANIMFS